MYYQLINIEFILNLTHATIITLCIFGLIAYSKTIKRKIVFLVEWIIALSVLLLMYLFCAFIINKPINIYMKYLIIGIFSSCSNILILMMASQIRSGKNKFNIKDKDNQIYILSGFIVIFLTAMIYWFIITKSQETHDNYAFLFILLLKIIPVQFSFISLYVLGKELQKYLVSLKKVTAYTFIGYAIYQLAFLLIPASSVKTFSYIVPEISTAQILEPVYYYIAMIFKVVCTFLIMISASEYSTRNVSRLLMQHRFKKHNPALEDYLGKHPFNKNIYIILSKNTPDELKKVIDDICKDNDFNGIQPGDLEKIGIADPSEQNDACIYFLCKYGIADIDESFDPNTMLNIGIMEAQKKWCLILRNFEYEAIPYDLGTIRNEKYDKNNIANTVPPLVRNWFNRIR